PALEVDAAAVARVRPPLAVGRARRPALPDDDGPGIAVAPVEEAVARVLVEVDAPVAGGLYDDPPGRGRVDDGVEDGLHPLRGAAVAARTGVGEATDRGLLLDQDDVARAPVGGGDGVGGVVDGVVPRVERGGGCEPDARAPRDPGDADGVV